MPIQTPTTTLMSNGACANPCTGVHQLGMYCNEDPCNYSKGLEGSPYFCECEVNTSVLTSVIIASAVGFVLISIATGCAVLWCVRRWKRRRTRYSVEVSGDAGSTSEIQTQTSPSTGHRSSSSNEFCELAKSCHRHHHQHHQHFDGLENLQSQPTVDTAADMYSPRNDATELSKRDAIFVGEDDGPIGGKKELKGVKSEGDHADQTAIPMVVVGNATPASSRDQCAADTGADAAFKKRTPR